MGKHGDRERRDKPGCRGVSWTGVVDRRTCHFYELPPRESGCSVCPRNFHETSRNLSGDAFGIARVGQPRQRVVGKGSVTSRVSRFSFLVDGEQVIQRIEGVVGFQRRSSRHGVILQRLGQPAQGIVILLPTAVGFIDEIHAAGGGAVVVLPILRRQIGLRLHHLPSQRIVRKVGVGIGVTGGYRSDRRNVHPARTSYRSSSPYAL